MRKSSILLWFVASCAAILTPGKAIRAQSSPGIPSDEAFINQVLHTVVDSAANRYYLFAQAAPCSFIRYDYAEWLKYDLQETVPIYILNELAKNAYFDRKSCLWQQDSLKKAACIGQEKIDSLLDPVHGLRSDSVYLTKRQKNAIARKWAAWSLLPAAEHTVFFFSRPVFTGDGKYAMLDMDYRCDNRQCGEGSICLFRREAAGWKLIGRRVRWKG